MPIDRSQMRVTVTAPDLLMGRMHKYILEAVAHGTHPGDALAHLTDTADVYRGDDAGLLRWLEAEIAALEAQTGEGR